MFVRELLERLILNSQDSQSYSCPMTKCHKTFAAPLQLIQHLFSCQEISNGSFDCDQCNHCHTFPTNEKDWAEWTSWTSIPSANIHRRRSFGSRVKEFALRKKEFRKQNTHAESFYRENCAMADSRPSTTVSQSSGTSFTDEELHQSGSALPAHLDQQHGHSYTAAQTPVLPTTFVQLDGRMLWTGLNGIVSDLSSTVSSTTPSSIATELPSGQRSQNSSHTALFDAACSQNHSSAIPTSEQEARTMLSAASYAFSTQTNSFSSSLLSFQQHIHPSSVSVMAVDEPLAQQRLPVSHQSMHSASGLSVDHQWWASKGRMEAPQLTPVSSEMNENLSLHQSMPGAVVNSTPSGADHCLSGPRSPCPEGSTIFSAHQTDTAVQSMAHALSNATMNTTSMTPTIYETLGYMDGQLQHCVNSLSPQDQKVQLPEIDPPSLQPQSDPLGASTSTVSSPTSMQRNLAVAETSRPTPAISQPQSPEDELVCDECQWKPRGVRENLKGYLRKHKNTHKGLRLACDVTGCTKTFTRLDNLKKHKKEKHGIDESGHSAQKRAAGGGKGSATTMGTETGAAVNSAQASGQTNQCHSQGESDIQQQQEQEKSSSPSAPGIGLADFRRMTAVAAAADDYPMLWPALHF